MDKLQNKIETFSKFTNIELFFLTTGLKQTSYCHEFIINVTQFGVFYF